MANIKIGFLFKKRYVEYQGKNYEVFEFLDYVSGIGFTNTAGNEICNIINGDYAGTYANVLSEDANEDEYVFVSDDIGKAIKDNSNSVDYEAIRKNKIYCTAKYYLRNTKGSGLTKLVNRNLIIYLENECRNVLSDSDEEEPINTNDILTMYSSIKETIISQDMPIKQILTTFYKNQIAVNSDLDADSISEMKEHILICGSTGTGKTEIIKRISKLCNIPMVIEDSTAFSETGYQGREITGMLEDLLHEANDNLKAAERGILVIDEFDKLAEINSNNNSESHVSKKGVQRSLLKLLDGTVYTLSNNKKFDTSKLTVVALGAFTGILEEKKRYNGSSMGFKSNNSPEDDKVYDYSTLVEDDFVRFGIIRELIGRFSNIVSTNSLTKEDMVKIIKESNFSPLKTYKKLFDIMGVDFDFNDEFIEYVAETAIAKNTGARSLKKTFDECISSALFDLFAGEYSSISLVKPDDDNDKPYQLSRKQ